MATTWLKRTGLGLERLVIYLPVALMAVLAMGAYWLLRATPEPEAPTAQRPVVHEPDYVMNDFSVRTYTTAGGLKSEVLGREARHYPDDGSLEVDTARIRALNPEGVLTTATSNTVWSNSAQDHFVLEGQVVVVREPTVLASGQQQPRLEFRGQRLRLWSDDQRLESDLPVLLIRGDDRITANSLRYTESDQVALLNGRVKAHLAARPSP